MGLFIIGIIILCVVFLMLYLYIRNNYDDILCIYAVIILCFDLVLFIFLIVYFIAARIENVNMLIEYENDRKYIEACYNNDNLTDNERQKINGLIINDNNIIIKTKTWRDNFWIGLYYPHKIGDLELFDIDRIQKAKMHIKIDKE